MAVNYSTISDKIFKVIKGSGHDIKMYDASTGDETVDPATSRYFYVKNPNYMVHIDEETGEIKFHQGADNSNQNLTSIINNIKHLAKGYMLDFDHRQFGRELKPKNYAFKVAQNKDTQMTDITTEGYSPLEGSSKTSKQKLEGVKVIVRHRKPVDEQVKGSRSRNISAIFIETAEGERFKYPHIHLNGARAMARHVSTGGVPHDSVGESIVELSDTLAKLKEVTRFARRFSQVQEQAADVLPHINNKVSSIKNEIHKLTTASGYTSFVKNLKVKEKKDYDISTLETLKNKFTVTKFDEKIGEMLPLIQAVVDEAKAEQDNSTEALMARIAQKLEAGDRVELSAPIRPDMALDKVGAFKDKSSELSYKLADAAGRIKDDEMSVFLARLSDKLGHMHRSKYEPQPTRQEISIAKQIMSQTQLAKAEQKELVPDVVSEIEETVKDFGTDESFATTEAGDLELKKRDSDTSKVDKAYKGVMSYVGKDVNPKMSYDTWLKKAKGIERGAHGISMEQHSEFSKEFRKYKGLKEDANVWLEYDDTNTNEGPQDPTNDNWHDKFTDKQIKMAFGILNDPRFKGGNYSGAYAAIEKVAKGLADHPSVANALMRANEDGEVTQADANAEEFSAEQDFEDYKDAVEDQIATNDYYKGMSKEQIIADLRKEANSLGYADVTGGGDRNPSEPGWLMKIADEMEKVNASYESVDPSDNNPDALAKEIYDNGYYKDEFQKKYNTWEEFRDSEDFEEEVMRLRSKFETASPSPNQSFDIRVADIGDFDLDEDRSIASSIEYSLKQSGIEASVDASEHDQAEATVTTTATEEEVHNALEKDGIALDYDNARDYDDGDPGEMDGDHDSAMTSAGWGNDEDYGYYGESKRLKELAGIPAKKD